MKINQISINIIKLFGISIKSDPFLKYKNIPATKRKPHINSTQGRTKAAKLFTQYGVIS